MAGIQTWYPLLVLHITCRQHGACAFSRVQNVHKQRVGMLEGQGYHTGG
jgi:hypothetical protein